MAGRGASVDETIRAVTTNDVRQACDLFTKAYEGSEGIDGRVSLDVDPRVAHDADKTNFEAIELWKIVSVEHHREVMDA